MNYTTPGPTKITWRCNWRAPRMIVTFRIPNGDVPIFHSTGISLELPVWDKSADNGHRSAINQIKQIKRKRGGAKRMKRHVDLIDRMKMDAWGIDDLSFLERQHLSLITLTRRIINLYQWSNGNRDIWNWRDSRVEYVLYLLSFAIEMSHFQRRGGPIFHRIDIIQRRRARFTDLRHATRHVTVNLGSPYTCNAALGTQWRTRRKSQ